MKIKSLVIILFIIFPVITLFPGTAPEGYSLFPEMEGFSFDGKMETYTPDTLFEYINGGADLFLNFEFVKLHSLRYKSEDGGEITADIYIHSDLSNGFGIYTQERPTEDVFIEIGTEGYYEEGLLNFFKGPAYVKISSFDLGKNEELILKKLAEGISGKIAQPKGYPAIFSKFPSENRVSGSEKFININFLGHSFLNRVYSREYSNGGKILRLFVIKNNSVSESEKVLSKYTEFVKGKSGLIKKEGKIVTFTDPYYKNKGKMNFLISGNILIGMFCDDLELFLKMARHIINKD
ncbi:MAG: hypothetical protein KAS21_06460 [Candidatus Aminicenantes bacterium]|nr:hypothetical protein [Candidatus Aminicenantes bacterium]